ncbi:MAG: rod shape-determining protein MreC, partial [Patescibacteria group bacterium]
MAKFLKQLAVLGALIALLFVLYSYRGFLAQVSARAGTSLRDFARGSDKDAEILALQSENQRLRNELAYVGEEAKRPAEDRYRYKIAEVHSRYPFNDQSAVFLSLGSLDGVREGMPVFVEKGVLLGKIKKVARTQSEVETILSPQWKTSVAVGEKKVKAVYAGGVPPELDLIPKDAALAPGDLVISIAPDLPLGTLLGKVKEAGGETYDVWQKAEVEPLFFPESFQTVLVLV